MIRNKKQMFIVIGVFCLILLLGTTTYAFFNYTRTGSANTIQVGRIYFNSEEGQAITLNNLFPIDTEDSIAMNDPTKVGSVTIHVTGDTTYSEGVEYLVKAVDVVNTVGTGQTAKTVPISVDIDYTATTSKTVGTEDEDYFDDRGPSSNTSIYKVLANDTIKNNDRLLVGYIKSGDTGIDGNIVIKAYLDKDRIAISDTYPAGEHSETIGEDTYEVNSNMSTSEFNYCVNYFSSMGFAGLPTLTRNSNMTSAELNTCDSYFNFSGTVDVYAINPNATETDISNCKTYFGNSAHTDPSNFDGFCRGTGDYQGTTLQAIIDSGSSNSMLDTLINNNINVVTKTTNTYNSLNFCNGTGTNQNGLTFQQAIDNHSLSNDQLTYLVEHNIILVSYQNIQDVENLCNGTGAIYGMTLQQMVDNASASSQMFNDLKNANVIIQTGYATTNSWTDETTSQWVAGRTVFTTTEWNSLQENGITFKVKVEANEGIWVNQTDESCFTINQNTITGYDISCGTDVYIPSKISGNTMTEIGSMAFAYKDLTSVYMADTITTVGFGAFSDNAITSVRLSNNLQTLSNNSFIYNELDSVSIPSSVATIGEQAFANNKMVGNLTIPNSVTTIGMNAFGGSNHHYTNVVIPNSVTTLGSNSFGGARIDNLSIDMTTIPDAAFNNIHLQTVTFGSNVKNINYTAFTNNDILAVTIPSTVEMMKCSAFDYQNNNITTNITYEESGFVCTN